MDIDMQTITAALPTGKTAKQRGERPDAAYIAKWAEWWLAHGYDDRDKRAFSELIGWCAYYRRGWAQKGLWLTGGNGTGKTRAMWMVAQWFRGRYITAREIVQHYAAAEDYAMRTLKTLLPPLGFTWGRSATDAGNHTDWLLCIDELGEEPVLNSYGTKTEVMAEVIAELYDHWRDHDSRLIVATNLTEEKLAARYGGRIVSRLGEFLKPVPFTGADRRLEQ